MTKQQSAELYTSSEIQESNNNDATTTTNDSTTEIALTPEEIEELLSLIKQKKTLQDITLYLMKKFKYPKNVYIKEKNKKLSPTQLSEASLNVSCVIKNKTVTLGATYIVNDENLSLESIHQDLYTKLLQSLENLITISLL